MTALASLHHDSRWANTQKKRAAIQLEGMCSWRAKNGIGWIALARHIREWDS